MSTAASQTDDRSIIELAGAIDIGCAADLRTAVLQAIAAGKAICISAEEVTHLDVAAFQVLWAAEREATQTGVPFALQSNFPQDVRSALAAAGLDVDFLPDSSADAGAREAVREQPGE